MGGGTADIIAHEKVMIDNKIYFDELYLPTGGLMEYKKLMMNLLKELLTNYLGKNVLKDYWKI